MYICLCKGITDTQIRKEVGEGVSCLSDLSAKTGVAAQCGRCAQCAKDVITSCQQGNCSKTH